MTPNPAVSHSLLSGAGLCVRLSTTGQRERAPCYGWLRFSLSQLNREFSLQKSPGPKL